MAQINSSDYKCEKCGNIDNHIKKITLDSFPQKILCTECGSDSYRLWGVATFDLAVGKCGNSKDGWKGGAFNHTSVLGKYKGTKVNEKILK